LPEITVRIGVAYGNALAILYGKSIERAHIDMVGSGITLASKIAAIAKPDQTLVVEFVYNLVKSTSIVMPNWFREITLDHRKWKYLSRSDPESMYQV
jgi:class 3 adenylate cyclase